MKLISFSVLVFPNQFADFWRNQVGVNVIPTFNKTKTPKVAWKKWQTEPIPQKQHDEWKKNNVFKDGLAIICGQVFHNKENDGLWLNGIDCDDKAAIDAMCPKGIEHMAKKTIVEQHKNKEKCHILCFTTEPLENRMLLVSSPQIEIKSMGKNLLYCAGGIHKDGSLIEIVGIKQIVTLRASELEKYLDEILKPHEKTIDDYSKQMNYDMRKRFKDGKLPFKQTSNAYFFNAALQCNTDGLTRQQSTEKIKIVFDKWVNSTNYSGREWSNIETAIDKVFDDNLRLDGSSRRESSKIDRTTIAQEIVESRSIYSDIPSGIIYENKNGFLEPINGKLFKELQNQYPHMGIADHKEIESKLLGLSDDMPPRNKDLIVFNNGIYSKTQHGFVESDDLAYIGFRDLDYIKDPNPEKFLEIMFTNVPKKEHPRIKSGLRSILNPYLDSRISVIYGLSGIGKSTGQNILVKLLGEYAMSVELDDLLRDPFIRAKIKGKTLLVLQELPTSWKDFTKIKALTGEQTRTEREFHSDSTQFENTIKIWASGNYLSQIPENEKNAMYTRRLSLIHNTRQKEYPEDPTLEERIIENEGSEIISWILNLTDEECQYEDGETVRKEWETLSNPENKWLDDTFEFISDTKEISLHELLRRFNDDVGKTIPVKTMKNALEQLGYSVYAGMIKNLRSKQFGNKDETLTI